MIRHPGWIAFIAFLEAGFPARAQSTPPSPPAASAPPPTAPAPTPPAPSPPAPAVELPAPFEEQAARRAKEAREAAIVTADDNGFALKRRDDAYALRLGAQVQVDGRFFPTDSATTSNDTFFIRRFRPSIQGTLFSIADYRFLPDFAGGSLQIMDGYLDLHPLESVRLRFGKYKGTLGLERLQNDADLPLFERGLDQNLSSIREIGVQIWGDFGGGLVTYAAGIVNGAPDNSNPDTDTNHAKDVQGRLFFQPFKAEGRKTFGRLGIGVAASTGNRKGRLPVAVSGSPVPTTPAVTGLGSYKTAGQNTFFAYYAPSTDTTGAQTTFAHERASHLDPQLYYYFGSFGLLAEYVWSRQGVQRGNSTAVLTNQSTHATAAFVVNGREGYDGATPFLGFDRAKGAWGALELAARVSWLKVDPATFGGSGGTAYADPSRSARSALAFAGGVSWVPRRSVHLGLNFEQTRFAGGAGTIAAVTNRPTENLLLGRAQVNF